MKINFSHLVILSGCIFSVLLAGCTRSASKAPEKPAPSLTPALIISDAQQAKVGEAPTVEPTATVPPTPQATNTPEPPTPEPLGTQYPSDSPYAGHHNVVSGETLYMLGRAYKVEPLAIADANGISAPYLIYPGDILKIPRIKWNNVPSGPVAAPQFQP